VIGVPPGATPHPLRCAARHPIAIPANLIYFLDRIGVEILVGFQHLEEAALLDAFFQLIKGPFDGHMT
jgi:hypothetical protein